MRLFAIPSRIYFRTKKFDYNFTFNFAHIQTLEGITSLLPNGKHVPLFDIEDCTLQQAEESLRYPQKKYVLSNIYIVSDIERSYRAFCYSQVDFETYLKILLDTEYLDWNFFDYTVRRKKATLRTSQKKDRPQQKLVSVLESYLVPIPKEHLERVFYDTGVEKKGLSILLGDEF